MANKIIDENKISKVPENYRIANDRGVLNIFVSFFYILANILYYAYLFNRIEPHI